MHQIGKELDDDVIVGRALLAQGLADSTSGVVDLSMVEQALAAGLRAGDDGLVACCYTNLYSTSVDQLRLDAYPEVFDEGMAYCLDHEEHTYSVCIRGSRVVLTTKTPTP